MKDNKIILFENLGRRHLPFIWLCAMAGYNVMFLKASKKVQTGALFKRMERQGRLCKLINEGFDLDSMYLPHRRALCSTEEKYPDLIGSGLSGLTSKWIKSGKALLFYKKTMAERLYNLYFIVQKAEEMKKDGKNIVFIPAASYAVIRAIKEEKAFFHIPLWARSLARASVLAEKARAVAGLPLWMLAKALLIRSGAKEKMSFRLGIRVYGTDLGFHFKYRSIDFLLDGKDLNAENTAFCAETPISDDYKAEFKKRSYRLFEMKDSISFAGRGFVWKKVLGFLFFFWPVYLVRAFFDNEIAVTSTMKIIRDELLWSAFADRCSVDNYVSYNDFEAKQMIRNIVLSRTGARTWYYPHTCNDTGLFAPDGSLDLRDYAFSYLSYDRFLSWGARMKGYYSSHINDVKNYDGTGCLWAEHVRVSKESGQAERFRGKVLGALKTNPEKMIGIFDTSFGAHESLLHEEDMKAFMEGIVWLLDSDPALAVVLKKKWKWEELKALKPEVKSIYEAIHSHPRCYVTGDDERDSADAMAASDLIISACFTSPTVEALSAGKKAIYFDATGRLKGFYYDRFPGMVAHGKEELKAAADSWLSMSGSEFAGYIEKYVRQELDFFADGKAITRFRKELIKKEG